MTLSLDDNQVRIVDTKRKPEGSRPKYYNAATKKQTEISADFEAFLILQGGTNNSNTVRWLDECTDFTIRDLSRDALAASAFRNEVNDAVNSQLELTSFISVFNTFRQKYSLTGFERVVEAGLLLEDLQRQMNEIQGLIDTLKHRVQYASLGLKALSTNGVTTEDKNQIDSWYSPLSAY
jgi:hypothetical protein